MRLAIQTLLEQPQGLCLALLVVITGSWLTRRSLIGEATRCGYSVSLVHLLGEEINEDYCIAIDYIDL